MMIDLFRISLSGRTGAGYAGQPAGFLHGGLFHIGMNSWVLFDLGTTVEQFYGTRRMLVMERLDGFAYEDVDAMREAGVDTAQVLRSLLISFLEGAMISGVFHGDLHGGNLFVTPQGRVALLDYGITGRLREFERLAFLRMMMSGAVNDTMGQLAAFRDLGALPPDADLDELAMLLKLDQPTIDPTELSGERLVAVSDSRE